MVKNKKTQTFVIQSKFTEFEWDERKRHQNIEKHGIDFRVVTHIFNGSVLLQRSDHQAEIR